MARFLLRSEGIASSRIEGIASSAQQVANNMTTVREATTGLVAAQTLTVDHVVELPRLLLPDEPRHHGLRTAQNWIGSSNWNPIGAVSVPPDPARMPELMSDLVEGSNPEPRCSGSARAMNDYRARCW